MICSHLKEADQKLLEASSGLRLLAAVRPLNEAEEKTLFLADKKRLPQFLYKRSTPRAFPGLAKLRIPDNALGRILEAQRRRLLKLESTLRDPSRKEYRDISREIYGSPSPPLISAALQILRRLPERPKARETLEEVKLCLEQALVEFGLQDWCVEYSPGDFTAARGLERKVMLTSVGPVVSGTGKRLAVHEVAVHALRAVNGFRQPLAIFGYGLPGYEKTEEGLATYAEVLTGTIDARVLRNYAARTVAVAGLEKGWDFRKTYQELRDLEQSPGQAWEATLRAHRGGGFIKDHIYLEGLLEIADFAHRGGDLRQLYMGKMGLAHLPLVTQALREGTLQPAARIPEFVCGQPVSSEVWDVLRDLLGFGTAIRGS